MPTAAGVAASTRRGKEGTLRVGGRTGPHADELARGSGQLKEGCRWGLVFAEAKERRSRCRGGSSSRCSRCSRCGIPQRSQLPRFASSLGGRSSGAGCACTINGRLLLAARQGKEGSLSTSTASVGRRVFGDLKERLLRRVVNAKERSCSCLCLLAYLLFLLFLFQLPLGVAAVVVVVSSRRGSIDGKQHVELIDGLLVCYTRPCYLVLLRARVCAGCLCCA